jgi:hypothetical protein
MGAFRDPLPLPLPTEEDVLTALLLRHLAIRMRAASASADVTFLWGIPRALAVLVGYSWDRDIVEAAIATAERRWEVERVEQEVLGVLRSFVYPRDRELRLLDSDPSPEEVLRWASTTLRAVR